MKKVILNLKKDRQVYVFVIVGLLLIAFPKQFAGAAPYILGITALLYAAVNIFISLKYPDAQTSLGDAVIKAVIGLVLLFLKEGSIAVIGVIWAVQSLHEVADEIDEYRETKHIRVVGIISIVISVILAAMLMINPFEHFSLHIRILGLEIISSAFVRKKKQVVEAKKIPATE